MKISHDDVARIPAPDLAILIALHWVREWPCELSSSSARVLKRSGYYELMRRARDVFHTFAEGNPALGEIVEKAS